jgi:hypothetical protein
MNAIQFPLDLRDEKQQIFIDAMNAALRESGAAFSMISASGNSTGDRGFESSLTVSWPASIAPATTTWKLLKDAKGTLMHLTVETEADENDAWKLEVRALVERALVAALADRKSKFFHRSEFYYIGPRLDGEYWLPGFRFAPGDPDEEQHGIFLERVVVIDQEALGMDSTHAAIVGAESARRYAARLSLLLNIGFYRPRSPAAVWVSREGDELGCERRFRGFYSEHRPVKMPRKRELAPLGRQGQPILSLPYLYGAYAGDLVTLPRESRRILRQMECTNDSVRDAFDRCARLYQVALVAGQQFPSVGLAYRVAAVDALAQTSGPWNGFSEFVRAHVHVDADTESLLESLYGDVRSAHFHAGKFPLGEFRVQRFDPLMDEAGVRSQEIGFAGSLLLRMAILSWISRVTGVRLEEPESL